MGEQKIATNMSISTTNQKTMEQGIWIHTYAMPNIGPLHSPITEFEKPEKVFINLKSIAESNFDCPDNLEIAFAKCLYQALPRHWTITPSFKVLTGSLDQRGDSTLTMMLQSSKNGYERNATLYLKDGIWHLKGMDSEDGKSWVVTLPNDIHIVVEGHKPPTNVFEFS